MAKVKVYLYKRHDKTTGEATIQRREATLETIRFAGLEPLMETEREVDERDIDAGGRVRREFWVNPRNAHCPLCSAPMKEARTLSGTRTHTCEVHGAWQLAEDGRFFKKVT